MSLPLDEIRALFPHTQTQIYLNHAAISPISLPVKTAVDTYLEQRHRTQIENYPVLMETMAQLRQQLASLIGASQPEQIAFVSNTSQGLNLLANGLDWQPGDRVLLNALEFPANVYPFLNLRSRGVEVDMVPARAGRIEISDLVAAIRPQTRLLSVSHVQFLTGQRIPLDELSQICRAYDLLFCVDGIQSLGAQRLDVTALGIDFLASGGHKWLMGLEGQGFVYIAPQLLKQLRSTQVGWLSVKNPWEMLNYQLDLLDEAARFELGTPNGLGLVALSAALALFSHYGHEAITSHILDLSAYLIQGLKARGIKVLTPEPPEQRLGIVTCEHPQAEHLYASLAQKQILLSVREGRYLRLTPHFYNTQTELDRVLHELDRLLKL